MSKGRIQFWLGLASLVMALMLGIGLASNSATASKPSPTGSDVPTSGPATADSVAAQSQFAFPDAQPATGNLSPLEALLGQSTTSNSPGSPLALGDVLWTHQSQTATGANVLLGVEHTSIAGISNFWVTGRSTTDNIKKLYKFDQFGAFLLSTVQDACASSVFGWRDGAYNGTNLAFADECGLDLVDPATGARVGGFAFPAGVTLMRAVAYNPASTNYFAANFGSATWEISSAGALVNTFPNPATPALASYGMAWDTGSAGGPYLWTFSQNAPDGTSAGCTGAAGTPNCLKATRLNPATGGTTGVAFDGTGSVSPTGGDIAGGADVDVISGTLTFVGLHQATPNDIVRGYDMSGVVNTPTITPTPTATITPICPGAWVAQAPYPAPALDQAIAVLGGVIYSFSGVVNGAISANSYKYDPGSNTWTAIAPLPSARENPSAVSDGTNIYIMGGNDSAGLVTGSLWRYSPGTDTYTALASYTTLTRAQTAAYLNGKIYKFGGLDSASVGVTALEIYDIVGGTWSTGASYPTAAGFLMGTALGNFVYGAGGISTAEITKTYQYDPGTNSWNDAAIADLPAPRWASAEDNLKNQWLLAGGYSNNVIVGSILRWNPNNPGVWDTALDPMPIARARNAGGTVGVSFYAVAGRDPVIGGFAGTTNNQRYTNLCQATPTGTPPTATNTNSPVPTQTPTVTLTPVCAAGAWTARAVVPIPIMDNAVTSVGGNVYSFAGVSANAIISASYKYDPVANSWTAIAPLPGAREQASAVSDGTFAYIMGGADSLGNNTNTLFRYDPVGNSYTAMASNPFTTTWAQAGAYLNGKIYWIAGCGGNCATFSNTVYAYDIAGNSWSAVANYPIGVGWLMATSIGNFVYAAGGVSDTEQVKTYRYDPAGNSWNDAAIADLPDGRWGAAEDNAKGKWVLAGGYTFTDPDVVATALVWNPGTNTWSSLDPMLAARGRLSGATVGTEFHAIGGRPTGGGFAGTTNNQRYSDLCQGSLVGHVIWQQIPQNDPRNIIPISLTLKLGGTYYDYPAQNVDSSGYFTVSVAGLPTGPNAVYDWRVQGPDGGPPGGGNATAGFLANCGTVTLSGAPTTQMENSQIYGVTGCTAAPGCIRGGDANNDNIVSIVDFNTLKAQFNQTGPTLTADFQRDLIVSIVDFNLLKGTFNQTGCLALSPGR